MPRRAGSISRARAVETLLCSAEPLSDAKRDKLARQWGAQVRDTFGMTEAGMMGAEDAAGRGFRIWTDMFLIEVLDPHSHEPVKEGAVGALVVTPLWTNTITPFLRWSSGDLVTWQRGDDASGPFSVFPLVKHAHRTSGFFKIRGINVNHADFEDFIFRNIDIGDFKAELITERDLEILLVSIEVRRGVDPAGAAERLKVAVHEQFELTPRIVVVETGTLAKEFEASVKMPRFVDRRQENRKHVLLLMQRPSLAPRDDGWKRRLQKITYVSVCKDFIACSRTRSPRPKPRLPVAFRSASPIAIRLASSTSRIISTCSTD